MGLFSSIVKGIKNLFGGDDDEKKKKQSSNQREITRNFQTRTYDSISSVANAAKRAGEQAATKSRLNGNNNNNQNKYQEFYNNQKKKYEEREEKKKTSNLKREENKYQNKYANKAQDNKKAEDIIKYTFATAQDKKNVTENQKKLKETQAKKEKQAEERRKLYQSDEWKKNQGKQIEENKKADELAKYTFMTNGEREAVKNHETHPVVNAVVRWANAQSSNLNRTGNVLLDRWDKGPISAKSQTLGLSIYDKDREEQMKENEERIKKADERIKKTTEEIEEFKEGQSTVGKFLTDVAVAGTELGLDLAAGKFTRTGMLPMFSRAAGQSAASAEDEGADRLSAWKYGMASGGIEALTEKMFVAVKPLNKVFGKGFTDELAQKAVNRLASKMTTEGGQKAVYHGGRMLAAAFGEGLEEMVSEGLDPSVANAIYADAIGQHKTLNPRDVLYSGLIGGTMGGLLGTGNVISENYSFNQNRESNQDNLDDIIKFAKDTDENSLAYKNAEAMRKVREAGEDVSNMQIEITKQELARDMEAQEKEYDNVINAANEVVRMNSFTSPVVEDNGYIVGLADNTEKTYNDTFMAASEAAGKTFDNDLDIEDVSNAVASIRTGTGTVKDTDFFMPQNTENRKVYEEVTGEKLPSGNVATRQYLIEKMGQNFIHSAQAETEYRNDMVKGEILQNEMQNLDAAGQDIFVRGLESVVDGHDAEYASLFRHYYRGGRAGGLTYETVANMNPAYNNSFPESLKRDAFNAGQFDGGYLTNRTAENSSGKGSGGRVMSTGRKVKASDYKFYQRVAQATGIDIEVTDNEGMRERLGQMSLDDNGTPNGFYDVANNRIIVNYEGDRAIDYIVSHELTHYMQDNAPEEYKALKEFLRKAWKEADIDGYNASIARKIQDYERQGVKLTEEEAFDEILADSTYEMIQNEDILRAICQENRTLAQKILDALKKILDMFRGMRTDFSPKYNKDLLNNLGVLEDTIAMWESGIKTASENRNIKSFEITKSDIEKSINAVIDMKPVSVLNDTEFSTIFENKGIKELKKRVSAYYEEIGGYAHSQDIGDVSLTKRGIKDDVGHGIGKIKADAFKTVPDVIEKGKIIQAKRNWKGRIYDSVVIAAPVEINGSEYLEGVVIKRDVKSKNQGLYVHEVLLQKNSSKKVQPGGLASKTSPSQFATINSLLQTIVDVKNGDISREELYKIIDTDEGRFSLKFSFAGESALNSDNEMLEKAKSMISDGVDAEVVRRETGWHIGKDGKWRFEIDDSQMEIFPDGDALFSSDHVDYKRWNDLFTKMLYGKITQEEFDELQTLDNVWSSEKKRLRDRVENGNATLENIIKHDVLFENYPQLRNIHIRLEDMEKNVNGAYSPSRNEIRLNRNISKPINADTLLHEIQHAIQVVEGFSTGKQMSDGETFDVYWDSDGEVEARTSAERRTLNSKERTSTKFSMRDSDGNTLTEAQAEYFQNSKVRDDSGELMVMYHSTLAGDFNVFDRAKASPEGDAGAGFYFTNNVDDADTNYGSVNGADQENKINRLAEEIEDERDIDYEEALEIAKNEFVVGENQFTVYLNIQNPVYVGERYGAETRLFDAAEYEPTVTEDEYDDYDEYIEAVEYETEEAFSFNMDRAAYMASNVSDEPNVYETVRNILADALYEGGITFEELKSKIAEEYLENGNEIARAVVEGLGYDGIIDSSVSDKWGATSNRNKKMLGVDENTVHAIVFNSNQIKNIDNENPTSNEDIRYSMRELDERYMAAVENGDMKTAQAMVNAYARERGYEAEEDYRGWHEAPRAPIARENFQNLEELQKLADDGDDLSLYAIANGISIVPDDFFTYEGARLYGNNDETGSSSLNVIMRAINSVQKRREAGNNSIPKISVYRAIPKDIRDERLRSGGQWVTPSRAYAVEHGKSQFGAGNYNIVRESVPVTELWWDGNDIREWGFDDGRNYAYRNTKNNRKLLDPVTYDGDGNVILLSKRFNYRDYSPKFSLKETEEVEEVENNIEDIYNSDETTQFHNMPSYDKKALRAKAVRQKSYEELQNEIQRLREEFKVTDGKMPDKEDIRRKVRMLVSETLGQNLKKGKKTNLALTEVITDQIYEAAKDAKSGQYESIGDICMEAARELAYEIDFTPNHVLFDYYMGLNEYLRQTPIRLTERDKANITDYNYLRKRMFGKVKLVNADHYTDGNIENVYMEMHELFPELISGEAEVTDDMLNEIIEVRENFNNLDDVITDEEFEQVVKDLAGDLLDITFGAKTRVTHADRWQQKYDKLKSDMQKALADANAKFRQQKKEIRNEERAWYREKRAEAVKKEREKAEKKLEKYKEKQKQKDATRRETAQRKESRTSIEKNLSWLSDRVLKPTDDKHLPEGFRQPMAEFLKAFDLQTNRSKQRQEKTGHIAQKTLKLAALRRAYESVAKEDGTGEFEYDGYIMDLMKAAEAKLDGKSLDEATTADMRDIDTILKAIRHNISHINKMFNENIKQTVSEKGDEIINEMSQRHRKNMPAVLKGIDRLLNESMVTPGDFFELLGSGMNSVYMPMRKGFDTHIEHMRTIREFFYKLTEGNENKNFRGRIKPGSELEKLRDTSQMQTFDLEGGGQISLNPAQIMSLYCLNKREQAQGHIYGSGIEASEIETGNRLKKYFKEEKIIQSSAVQVTPTDVAKITSTLTEEQRDMADKMMRFLNTTCAEWGNEASMKLYGYKKFTERNYFPIQSADAYLDSNFDRREVNERIKNFGFTKGTVVNANNPIMIADIFEVVSDHINKMSLYGSLAVPIADFQRVYNYKPRNEDGTMADSVKARIREAFGEKPITYIKNFMADINNNTTLREEGMTRVVTKLLANYKKAAIGMNLRVLVQQPTAVVRAFTYISPKYFVGIKSPRKAMKEMQKYCPIAFWKHLGHSQTDVARDIDDIMMNREWSTFDLVSMRPYGYADDVTWGIIWTAVKREVKATHPDVKEGSEEFWKLCSDRASEIYDKTQVVDSPFHRSQVMRNKGIMEKGMTSFMAEPTRTFNMVRTELVNARRMWVNGDKKAATAKANRALSVYLVNAAFVSAMAAVVDAMRGKEPDDEDKDKKGFELWLANFENNFSDNASPLNNIVLAKDIWQLRDGWGTSNMALEGFEALWKNINGWRKYAAGESDKSALELTRGSFESAGMIFGIPGKNMMRELETILGDKVLAAEPGKEQTNAEKAAAEYEYSDSLFDKIASFFGGGKSEVEKQEKAFNDRAEEVQNEIEGLSGEEKEDKLWSVTTKNYTKVIEEGDYATIKNMRSILERLGSAETVEKFDEKVESYTLSNFKKTVGTAKDDTVWRDYMIQNLGYDENKISEVVCKTDTAKSMQQNFATGNDDAGVVDMAMLIMSGATKEDLYELYVTRSKSIKATDYATGDYSAPLEGGTVSSSFGWRNIGRGDEFHAGVDIAAAAGTDVKSMDGGKVTYAGWNNARGYYIRVSHGNNRTTLYQHLNDYTVLKGDVVKPGQIIGHVGSTGDSTGPHLHLEMKIGGEYVDPTMFW